MEPPLDWLQWFTVSIPVSAVSLLLIWLLLLAVYRPARTADGSDLQIKPIRPTREKFTVKQWWVCFVCVVTIALWCVEHTIQDIVGDMGVIAIIPIVAFFGTGVLKKASLLRPPPGLMAANFHMRNSRRTLTKWRSQLSFLPWVVSRLERLWTRVASCR
jgi:di/tricarboxylate transporter